MGEYGGGYGSDRFVGYAEERFGEGAAAERYGGYGQAYGGGHGGEKYEEAASRARPPRGYRRSDERIRDEVYERLAHQDWIDAEDVEVRCEDGVVTLTGTVERRRDRRVAEDLAHEVRGVHDVMNELRARSAAPGGAQPGGTR
jgi:osmotically-inducible protein OsmY